MIYFLSDMHGYDNFECVKKYASENHEDDLLIILGDIGLHFPEREDYLEFTKEFLSLKCPIAFIDGNHENFDFLEGFPLEDFCGGKIRRITPNLMWLQRGYIYTIENKTFFTFGGGKSGQKWYEKGLVYPQEIQTKEQVDFAIENLKKVKNKVDYVLTHKYQSYKEEKDENFAYLLKYLDEKVDKKAWYSGHWHFDGTWGENHYVIYDKITKL